MIPTTRTTTPFSVESAFGGLSETLDQIDTDQLAKAFDTISDTFKDSPDSVKASLTGLSRLSQTLSSREQQLRSLLDHANGVTGVLAARDQEFTTLIRDGDLLLQAVQARREVIHQLLVNTAALGQRCPGWFVTTRRS